MFEVKISAEEIRKTMLNEIKVKSDGRIRLIPKNKFKKYFNRNNKIDDHYLIKCNWFLFEAPNEDYNIIEENNYYSFSYWEHLFSFYFYTEEEAFYFKMKYG